MSFILDKDKILKQKEIEDAFASIAKSMQPLIENIKQAAIEGKKLSDAFGGADKLKEIINLSSKVTDNEKKTAQAKRELAAEEKKLLELNAQSLKIHEHLNKLKVDKQKKVEAQASRELAAEEKKLIASKKLLITAQQAEKGSAQQLQAVNAILKNRMKQLNVLIPEQAKKYEQLNAAINRNTQRITDLGGMNTTFGKLASSAIQYIKSMLGIYLVIDAFRKFFNLSKEFDAVDFAMKTVIKNQDEIAKSQQFLTQISLNYGLNLISLSQRYIKFRAAAIQSNITMQDTQNIFNSMAKISAVLGLKTDEVSGVFLALEQMLSKGKITTEELRRQLGERLPGAFGIMARTLKVTIPELDKMLKKGEVLSGEVLPKFAKEAEKAFGTETTNKVSTLNASINRLYTTWQLLVKRTDKTWLSSIIDMFTIWSVAITNVDIALKSLIPNFIRKYSESDIERLFDIFSTVPADTKHVEKFQKVLKDWGKETFELLETQKKANIQYLDDIGFTTTEAKAIYEEYLKRRKQQITEEKELYEKTVPIKASDLKQELDEAKNDFDIYSETKDEKLKQSFIIASDYVSSETKTYKEHLNKRLKFFTENAEKMFSSYDEMKDKMYNGEIEISASNESELEQRYRNFQEYTKARVEAQKRLSEFNKLEDKNAKTKIQLIKEGNEKELFEFEQSLKIKTAKNAEALDEQYADRDIMAEMAAMYQAKLDKEEYNNKVALINKKIELEQKLLKQTKSGSVERAEIESNIAKLQRDLESENTDYTIKLNANNLKIRKGHNKDIQTEEERISQETLENTKAEIDEEQLKKYEAAQQEIIDARGNAEKIADIEHKLTQDILKEERDRLQAAIDSGDLR
ncbi:MAG: tape measure protein, partial [Lutibacter sp.]